MSGVIHMETDEVRGAAQRLINVSETLETTAANLLNQIHTLSWEGPSRDLFLSEFEQIMRVWRTLAEALYRLSGRALTEANEWEMAASVFASGPIGLGILPGIGEDTILPGGMGPIPTPVTLALGEERFPLPVEPVTMAWGVENGQTFAQSEGQLPFPPPIPRTMAYGIDDGPVPMPPPAPGWFTTAIGEEIPFPGDPGPVTTLMMGEEGQMPTLPNIPPDLPMPSTMAVGEEGQMPTLPNIPPDLPMPSTMAVGEEGQMPTPSNPITLGIGEDIHIDLDKVFKIRADDPLLPLTLAVGEQ